MRILVTGGSGFIGSHLIDKLLELGYEVLCYDNFSTGDISNIAHNIDKLKFHLFDGSTLSLKHLREAMAGVNVVVHLAAIPSVQYTENNEVKAFENNVLGTYNVLQAAKESGVKRVVFSSSSSVYGDYNMKVNEQFPRNPRSLYAHHKIKCEELGQMFFHYHDLDFISLRFFNVYGPRQSMFSEYPAVIPAWIKAIRNGENPIIFGSGEQIRSFTYVSDVVDGIVSAINKKALRFECFNLASDESHSLNEVYHTFKEVSGYAGNAEFKRVRKSDIVYSGADIEKAMEILDFNPSVDLLEGLTKTWLSM